MKEFLSPTIKLAIYREEAYLCLNNKKGRVK
jgi:hypothetical protein